MNKGIQLNYCYIDYKQIILTIQLNIIKISTTKIDKKKTINELYQFFLYLININNIVIGI